MKSSTCFGDNKKLLSIGLETIFQFSHVFRNDEESRYHLSEFSLLEWYRANCGIKEVINDCEQIIKKVFNSIIKNFKIQASSEFNPFLPIKKITMQEVWEKYAKINLRQILEKIENGNVDALVNAVIKNGHILRENATFEDAFIHIMLKCIEPNIGNQQACAIIKWPAQMASLAKLCSDDPLFSLRFEIYANGLELANGFDELTDPVEQKKRFVKENIIRKNIGIPELPIDFSFLKSLNNMPSSAGVAMGFDRLLMILLNKKTIRSVMPLK